ncbi:acetylglutamate kinase [Vibrio sp. SS-MA-C1-2]|uniref:acetylglutamate kinase n=1 Tax=Vibrio sp. SS-MA-C1-2 TaxID=2908646 RepID=UPI002882DB95|nr:acetylglutamate kinase [Vibrio sp. SS-MA-C1-2]
MSHLPLVIKLGGAVLSNQGVLEQLFSAIKDYQQHSSRPLVIVHGGGYLVDDLMNKLSFETVKKQGLRVTPAEHIPYVTGALAGTANKLLQGVAIKSGLLTVGLGLADGGLCQVEQLDPELGSVGKVSPGNSDVLQQLLTTGVLPIISSIGIDSQGELMNVNADQAAVAIAATLDAELVLLSDVQGVLDGNGELIPSLSPNYANELIESGVISDGMLVKVKAAFEASHALGKPIKIATWRYPEKLTALFKGEQFQGENIGTLFSA